MSVAEVVEQFRNLPIEERREAFEQIREVVADVDDELTPEQIAELDRRAEDALKHPGRGTPVEEVSAEIRHVCSLKSDVQRHCRGCLARRAESGGTAATAEVKSPRAFRS